MSHKATLLAITHGAAHKSLKIVIADRHYEGAGRTVRAVRLFYLDNLPNAIVLLCRCPMGCGVAELVPHFTLHALTTELYMLFLGL